MPITGSHQMVRMHSVIAWDGQIKNIGYYMNETYLNLITSISNKLGTTAEHLWRVLVYQAPISGITSLLIMGVIAYAIGKWTAYVKHKTTRKPNVDHPGRYYQEW